MSDIFKTVVWKIVVFMGIIGLSLIVYKWFPIMWQERWTDAIALLLSIGLVIIHGIEELIGVDTNG